MTKESSLNKKEIVTKESMKLQKAKNIEMGKNLGKYDL